MKKVFDFKYRPFVLVGLWITVTMAWWYKRDIEIIVTIDD